MDSPHSSYAFLVIFLYLPEADVFKRYEELDEAWLSVEQSFFFTLNQTFISETNKWYRHLQIYFQ